MKTFRELCLKYNTTISEVAKKSNMTYGVLKNYNMQTRCVLNMSINSANKIATALDINLEQLYKELCIIENNKKKVKK